MTHPYSTQRTPRTQIPRTCMECGIAFTADIGEVNRGGGKYCTLTCGHIGSGRSRRGKSVERFWSNVHKTDTCWLWTGKLGPDGYARFMVDRKIVGIHRFAHEIFIGPIPEGWEVDHVLANGCHNRHCVNPAHLEAVPSRINNDRSNSASSINSRKTHCIHGHEFTPENTGYRWSKYRRCKACRKTNMSGN